MRVKTDQNSDSLDAISLLSVSGSDPGVVQETKSH
jgi:hypothetical protein